MGKEGALEMEALGMETEFLYFAVKVAGETALAVMEEVMAVAVASGGRLPDGWVVAVVTLGEVGGVAAERVVVVAVVVKVEGAKGVRGTAVAMVAVMEVLKAAAAKRFLGVHSQRSQSHTNTPMQIRSPCLHRRIRHRLRRSKYCCKPHSLHSQFQWHIHHTHSQARHHRRYRQMPKNTCYSIDLAAKEVVPKGVGGLGAEVRGTETAVAAMGRSRHWYKRRCRWSDSMCPQWFDSRRYRNTGLHHSSNRSQTCCSTRSSSTPHKWSCSGTPLRLMGTRTTPS